MPDTFNMNKGALDNELYDYRQQRYKLEQRGAPWKPDLKPAIKYANQFKEDAHESMQNFKTLRRPGLSAPGLILDLAVRLAEENPEVREMIMRPEIYKAREHGVPDELINRYYNPGLM